MKVWITKYALTQGIVEKEVEIHGNLARVSNVRYAESYYAEGKEWHLTREEAIKKAEEMKLKKIKSLKKQIDKLEKLSFN